jgi:hypothetical protein
MRLILLSRSSMCIGPAGFSLCAVGSLIEEKLIDRSDSSSSVPIVPNVFLNAMGEPEAKAEMNDEVLSISMSSRASDSSLS